MLEPTRELFKIAENKNVHYTFFVDVGYLVNSERYPELEAERLTVIEQIREMIRRGHDVQLHIHPHWEKSIYKDGKWIFGTRNYYKLSDFSKEESANIVRNYKAYLEEITGKKVLAFRAGGWCIQPFEHIRDVFEETGIKIDSTVIPGDFLQTDSYAVDFRHAPMKSKYSFNSDPLKEEDGPFIEYPIGSLRYSPLFFWQLYILGRLFPAKHKMVGDGEFLSQGGRKKQVLLNYTSAHISTDGYYAKKLNSGLEKHQNLGFENLVIIGHPKGNTQYSIAKLEAFIERHHTNHRFISFQEVV